MGATRRSEGGIVSGELALVPGYVADHVRLSVVGSALTFSVGMVISVLIGRIPRLEAATRRVADDLDGLPRFAVIAAVASVMATLGLVGHAVLGPQLAALGLAPLLVFMVLTGVQPVMLATVPALARAREGEEGARERALPEILASLREATLWNVGLATLATVVGGRSLGNLVLSGQQMMNFVALGLGILGILGVGAVLTGLIWVVDRALARGVRPLATLGIAVIATLVVGSTHSMVRADGPELRIGAKYFTEQFVLGEILAQQVERTSNRRARVLRNLGTSVVFDALRTGALDAYVDYSGTIWLNVMKREDPPPRGPELIALVSRFLRETYGVEVLGPLGFVNNYALVMRRADAETRGVVKISDLRWFKGELTIGGDAEFFARPEWTAIRERYAIRFRERKVMPHAEIYDALDAGKVDVVDAFTTDGELEAHDVVVLQDDRGAIPPYDALVLIRPGLRGTAREAVAGLADLVGTIDAHEMRRMNWAVDGRDRSPADVAREFLERTFGEAEPPSAT